MRTIALDAGSANTRAWQSLTVGEKATANPQGELKARLDAVDMDLTAAMRAGNAGEARRQLAKGLAPEPVRLSGPGGATRSRHKARAAG